MDRRHAQKADTARREVLGFPFQENPVGQGVLVRGAALVIKSEIPTSFQQGKIIFVTTSEPCASACCSVLASDTAGIFRGRE